MKNKIFNYLSAGCALSALLIAGHSPALAVGNLSSPLVEQGEFEVEYSAYRSFDNDSTVDNEQKHKLEMSYGFGEKWKSEISAEFKKEPDESIDFTAIEIENQFQLTEQGEYWVDVGAKFAYVQTFDSTKAQALEAKLLLRKDTTHFAHIANIGAEQPIGSDAHDGPELSFDWGSRYRYSDHFNPGFEYQADFGHANDIPGYDEQEHIIGPMAYGKISDGVKYELGYLFGISDAAADGYLKGKLEYEVHF